MHFKARNIVQETLKDSPINKYFTFDKNYHKCSISIPKEEWRYTEL